MSPVACVFVRGFVSGSVSRGSFERVSSSLGFSSSLSGSPSTFVLLAVSASMVFVVGDGMRKKIKIWHREGISANLQEAKRSFFNNFLSWLPVGSYYSERRKEKLWQDVNTAMKLIKVSKQKIFQYRRAEKLSDGAMSDLLNATPFEKR